jgi:hypothetical protein
VYGFFAVEVKDVVDLDKVDDKLACSRLVEATFEGKAETVSATGIYTGDAAEDSSFADDEDEDEGKNDDSDVADSSKSSFFVSSTTKLFRLFAFFTTTSKGN